jgi:hypothetical protein
VICAKPQLKPIQQMKLIENYKRWEATWTRSQKLVLVALTMFLLGVALYATWHYDKERNRAEFWRYQWEIKK